jgi:hypothetical protein
MGNTKQKPISKFRAGALSSSVWENTGKKEDGTEFQFHTIQLQRSFKDEGNPKADKNGWVNETMNLRKNDVANLVIVVKKAHQNIVLKTE